MTASNQKRPASGSQKSQVESGANGRPVGYRNPPKRTQFQKGKSGNPGGRERNPPPLDFDQLLIRLMESQIGGKICIELMMEVQLKQALKANNESYKILSGSYVAAKNRQRHSKSYDIADQQAAERLLSSFNEFINQLAHSESTSPPTSDDE